MTWFTVGFEPCGIIPCGFCKAPKLVVKSRRISRAGRDPQHTVKNGENSSRQLSKIVGKRPRPEVRKTPCISRACGPLAAPRLPACNRPYIQPTSAGLEKARITTRNVNGVRIYLSGKG